ncbi:MAG: Gx transporter family protein [Defluviitaleaceae bacterium]|nr:Gx transporter family protein [Defluviitaleaceae bacterium]
MNNISRTRSIAITGIFVSFAVILSFLERLLPAPVPLPGIKLGLANIIVIIFLYRYGVKEAAKVQILRILLFSALFGGIGSAMYSFAGGALSLGAMTFFKKVGVFGVVGVSVAGGVFHNVGQIAIAAVVVQSAGLFAYLPALIISGQVAGLATGLVAFFALSRLRKIENNSDD